MHFIRKARADSICWGDSRLLECRGILLRSICQAAASWLLKARDLTDWLRRPALSWDGPYGAPLVTWVEKKKFCGHELITCGNEILFRGHDLFNAWERDPPLPRIEPALAAKVKDNFSAHEPLTWLNMKVYLYLTCIYCTIDDQSKTGHHPINLELESSRGHALFICGHLIIISFPRIKQVVATDIFFPAYVTRGTQ